MAWEQLLYGAPKPPDAVGSFLTGQREATANAENSYNLYQKRKLQELMSDRSIYNPDGSINYALLQDKGAAAGIGKTALDESTSQIQKKWEAANRVAENKASLDMYGVDLNSAAPQVPGGLPMPTAENPAPVGASWTDAWDNPAQSAIGESAPKVEVPEGQAMNLGSTILPGSDNWLDQYFPIKPKTAQWFDKVDNMRPRLPGGSDMPDVSGDIFSGADIISYDAIAKDPAQKGRIDQLLSGYGIKEPGQGGIDMLIEKARNSVPVPVFNQAARLAGKEEYAKEVGRYQTAKAEYPAKVQDAINKTRNEILAGLGTMQAQDLSRQSNERAKTEQEYGLAGQRDEDIFARPVSDDEATRVKMYRAVIDDIQKAPSDTFEGQYQMALAKAKADGSVNAEAILANLIAMGAVPNSAAVELRAMMSESGTLTPALIRWIYSEGKEFLSKPDPTKVRNWKARSIDNVNQSVKDNGGREVKFFTDGTIAMIDGAPAVYKGGKWIRLKVKK